VGEVDAAAADGQVDVARHGVSDVYVRDAAGEAIDELAGIAAGSDDVAEVHHHLYRGACEPVGDGFRVEWIDDDACPVGR
jgi:hypothetical protein